MVPSVAAVTVAQEELRRRVAGPTFLAGHVLVGFGIGCADVVIVLDDLSSRGRLRGLRSSPQRHHSFRFYRVRASEGVALCYLTNGEISRPNLGSREMRFGAQAWVRFLIIWRHCFLLDRAVSLPNI